MATNPPLQQQGGVPKESTKWFLEKAVAFLQVIMVLLMTWFGSTVLKVEKSVVKITVKQDDVIKHLDHVRKDIKGLERSVIKLEVVAERELHNKGEWKNGH